MKGVDEVEEGVDGSGGRGQKMEGRSTEAD